MTPPNYRIKLTVRPVTSLAKDASAAPGRPAAYAERYADKGQKMKRAVLAAMFVALHSVALATVPITPAKPEVTTATQVALRKAFSSAEALRQSALPADTVSIGPRLWAATAEARKAFASVTKDTYAIVPTPEIVSKWKLSPLDLTTIADPTLRATLTEGAKSGTPVLAGAIMKRGSTILPALVLDQVKTSGFPFSVRVPTQSEVEYYYSLIPYDLSDPILVVEGGGHSFICDFDESSRLFYVEML